MASNSTAVIVNSTAHLSSSLSDSTVYPCYFIPRPTVLPGISDHVMAAAAPIVAYWFISLIFHVIDMGNWKCLNKYKIHDTAEVQAKNTACCVPQVKRGNHVLEMQNLASTISRILHCLGNNTTAERLMDLMGEQLVHYAYWWGIPFSQFLLAVFVMDTWQYFLHRAMHSNRFLYKYFHSMHHRLYVPYAYGAMYGNPIETLLLDSMGAVISGAVVGLSVRQTALFFAFSSCKTVDDHSGYNLPWDPFQMFSRNTADYHDLHHQINGIKFNFSQPFFIHWDVFLGTRITRKELESLKYRQRRLD